MKYLSDDIEQSQTELFTKTGTFFAFSTKQYNEQANKKIEYIQMGAGMITPTENVKEVIETMHQIIQDGMDQDIKENGHQAIILRELQNHEAFYTNDTEETIEALKDYPGITKQDITKVYRQRWNEIR
jgi:hypothetical protein